MLKCEQLGRTSIFMTFCFWCKRKKEVKKSDAFEFVWRIFYFVFTKFLPERHSCCKLIHLLRSNSGLPALSGRTVSLVNLCGEAGHDAGFVPGAVWASTNSENSSASKLVQAVWHVEKQTKHWFHLLTNIQCSLSKMIAKQIIQAWVVQNYCLTQMLHTRFCCQRPAEHLAVSPVGGQCT